MMKVYIVLMVLGGGGLGAVSGILLHAAGKNMDSTQAWRCSFLAAMVFIAILLLDILETVLAIKNAL